MIQNKKAALEKDTDMRINRPSWQSIILNGVTSEAYDFLWYEYIEVQTKAKDTLFIFFTFFMSWFYFKAKDKCRNISNQI